jgi:hypothetical protein
LSLKPSLDRAKACDRDCLLRFDTVIVATSIVSIVASDIPGMKLFRLARVFRVFRMLRIIKSLRTLVNALISSLKPVGNAFVLVLLICCLYSIMGTR